MAAKVRRWRQLDNAAKIFPPTTTRADSKVFRLTVELTEPVDPATLQKALDATVNQHPMYRCVLKKGFFWYYFEESSIPPTVAPDTLPVCHPLYDKSTHSLLFRVAYDQTRIVVEVFHALADGRGAVAFTRDLVYAYLAAVHGLKGRVEGGAPMDGKELDAFRDYYDKHAESNKGHRRRAYKVRGQRLPQSGVGVVEGRMSVREVLDAAHAMKATLGEYLLTMLIAAICQDMSVKDRALPIVVAMPVDLRRFFPSDTTRNFFGVIPIEFDPRAGIDVDTIFPDVMTQVRALASEQYLKSIIRKFSAIEHNAIVKAVPLAIKTPSMFVAGRWSDGQETASFSNVGQFQMPDDAAPFICAVDVIMSAPRPRICVATYQDTLSITVASALSNTALARRFFRSLAAAGMHISVASNLYPPDVPSVPSVPDEAEEVPTKGRKKRSRRVKVKGAQGSKSAEVKADDETVVGVDDDVTVGDDVTGDDGTVVGVDDDGAKGVDDAAV